jgi:acetylglutamate kinase
MDELIRKADILIEAMPYIRKFRNSVSVIKYGGSIRSGASNAIKSGDGVLQDVVFLSYVGIKPVVVHGGGPHITERMREAGKEAEFVDGFRVTAAQTMKIVEDTLSQVNREIAARIKKLGGKSRRLLGNRDGIIRVRKHVGTKDLGFVGDIVSIDTAPIRSVLEKGEIPVICPVGLGRDGKSYNVNADTAASAIAGALKAEKFILLTDVRGIMRDMNNGDSLISTLALAEIDGLIAENIIQKGMIPKVRACTEALKRGVKKTHVINGNLPHSILLEIFTDKGIGTEIVKV